MCDTFIALGGVTKSGSAIMGKNSDREPNEAQEILQLPAVDHSASRLKCTYIEIPQVSYTYKVILSKPFQMWGAEMGCNEHGVAIGNEAIFTNIRKKKDNSGLSGMDIVRLGLERSKDAQEALNVCTDLIELYGQDACGGYQDKSFYYDNSFIISDGEEAWKLESAGRSWAAKKVVQFDAISNGISITDDYDTMSLEGKYKTRVDREVSFKKLYANRLMDRMTRWKQRQSCSYNHIRNNLGKFDLPDAISLLSTHESPQDKFDPAMSSPRSICMHATGILNPSQTTGSMVIQWHKHRNPTIWVTGTSMPCLSIYKPLFFGYPIPMITPSEKYDESLWWQAERLHRWIAADYQSRNQAYRMPSQKIQKLIFSEMSEVTSETNAQALIEVSTKAWERHYNLINEHAHLVQDQDINPKGGFNFFYNRMWKKYNRVFWQ